MLKVELLAGHLFSQDSHYGIKCTTMHMETKSTCDYTGAFPYLDKLSDKERFDLCYQLSYLINDTILGVLGLIPTIPYPKIAPPEPEFAEVE